MPLIATCPSCSAAFVVSQQQLTAHKGDVRCGKCKTVFNALNHLSSLDDTNTKPPTAEITAEDFAEELATEEAAPQIETTKPVAESKQATVIPAFNAANFNLDNASGSYAENPAFELSSTNQRASWIWWLLSVLLVIALVLQATYYFRTDIAAQFPQAKPYLEQACKTLGCEIELPKDAKLLVIDDSDLQEDTEREGLIRFNTTLLNRAAYAQAYPLLELTLTDAKDKVLIRKRFKPKQYLEPNTPIDEGIPANDSVYIKLALTANKQPVAGYRLFITY